MGLRKESPPAAPPRPSRGGTQARQLVVAAGLALVTLLLYGHVPASFFNIDDLDWLSGRLLGNPWRLTQHFLLYQVGRPLFGENPAGYYWLTLALHLANAVLLYLLFPRLLGPRHTTLEAQGLRLHAGGALAACLFLFYASSAPTWLSALSYMLVLFFALVALHLLLTLLAGGHPAWWAGVMAATGLGLISHSFALTLPALYVLVELLHHKAAGTRPAVQPAVLRYGLLALLLALFVFIYRDTLMGHQVGLVSQQDAGSLLLLYVKYVRLAVAQFLRLPVSPRDVPGWELTLWAVGLGAVTAWGVWEWLQPHRRPGLGVVLLLGIPAWYAVTFFQSVSAMGTFQLISRHRFYFNAAGVCLAAAFAAVRLTEFATRHHRPARRAAWCYGVCALLVLVPATLDSKTRDRAARWTRVLVPPAGQERALPWKSPRLCDAWVPTTPDDAAALVESHADLSCRDLRHLDLAGADLAGRNLRGANLSFADLTGADFTGADLTGAWLLWSDLSDATLTGATLAGAYPSAARAQDADFSRTDLTGTIFLASVLDGADFSHADFTRGDLRQSSARNARLRHTTLHDALIDGADLKGADLTGTDLRTARDHHPEVRQ